MPAIRMSEGDEGTDRVIARILRIAAWVLAVLYLLALLVFAVGTLGLFGQERDPLSAVYLIPLGLPWLTLVDLLPEGAGLWLGMLTPLLNIAILFWLSSWFRGKAKGAST